MVNLAYMKPPLESINVNPADKKTDSHLDDVDQQLISNRRKNRVMTVKTVLVRLLTGGFNFAVIAGILWCGITLFKAYGLSMLIFALCGIPAFMLGVLMIDKGFKAFVIYCSVVSLLGWAGFRLIASGPSWLSYVFVGIVVLVVVSLIFAFIDYMVKGKYK